MRNIKTNLSNAIFKSSATRTMGWQKFSFQKITDLRMKGFQNWEMTSEVAFTNTICLYFVVKIPTLDIVRKLYTSCYSIYISQLAVARYHEHAIFYILGALNKLRRYNSHCYIFRQSLRQLFTYDDCRKCIKP